MVTLLNGTYLINDELVSPEEAAKKGLAVDAATARKGTMAYRILEAHQQAEGMDDLRLKFDALASHDITYVGIIQTAIASGLDHFPLPYVLTNCHNSLGAVGGTINEDDHVFGLSAVKRFGGTYVPPHLAVIHQYMREMMAGGGKMILGSDSHTRYGALGTMAIGEGGPELVKQLLGRTYDIKRPDVIAIYLTGKPKHGVGPQDVALAIEKAVFKTGFVKNKVMEFVGPGIASLSMDFRNGIDVMSTETTCLSTIWKTDQTVKDFLTIHGRPDAYREMKPADVAYYDGVVVVDLDKVESMIAMPFHPSNVYTIKEVNEGGLDLLRHIEEQAVAQLDNKELSLGLTDKYFDGKMHCDQGIIVGCSGGLYENIVAANILGGKSVGNGRFAFSVYPSSQPIYLELMKNGALIDLMEAGAIVRTAFCGPCFGAGDTPNNEGFSVRHATRNFPNREGSKPGKGQISSVALMDARSVAATAMNGGALTPATDVDYDDTIPPYHYDGKPYEHKVYNGFGHGDDNEKLIYAPSIKAWPKIQALQDNVLLKVAAYIDDPVTTTDELIPSGETSSYRSDPYALSEFALSRKVPEYVGRAKAVRTIEKARQDGEANGDLQAMYEAVKAHTDYSGSESDFAAHTSIGSTIYANKPGDGSAREQAASCQRVLGGAANIAREYATKRYRSNVMNWGMLPFLIDEADSTKFGVGDLIWIPNARNILLSDNETFTGYVIHEGKTDTITLTLGEIGKEEKAIIASGCLINYYADSKK